MRSLFIKVCSIALGVLLCSCQKDTPEAMKSVSFAMESSLEYGQAPVLHISTTRPGQELTLSVDIDGRFSYCKDENITMPQNGQKDIALSGFDFTPGQHTVHAEAIGCVCGKKATGDFTILILQNALKDNSNTIE